MNKEESDRFEAHLERCEQNSSKFVNWTPEKLRRFKIVVGHANEAKADRINFDGNLFVVDYALYLIQYLETKMKG